MPKTDRYFTIEQAKNNYNLFITQILAHEKKKRKKNWALRKHNMHNNRNIAHSKWHGSLTVIVLECIVEGSGFVTKGTLMAVL